MKKGGYKSTALLPPCPVFWGVLNGTYDLMGKANHELELSDAVVLAQGLGVSNERPNIGDDVSQRCSGSGFGCGQVSLSQSQCLVGHLTQSSERSCKTWV